QSRTATELTKLLAIDDHPDFTEQNSDRLSMLLAQATCRDFGLAQKLLSDRALSPRQWRRVLNSAAARESMRLLIDQQLDRLPDITDDEEPAALAAAEQPTNPNAWKVI